MLDAVLAQEVDLENDPSAIEEENLKRRKRLQHENIREYDNAIISLKQKVKEMEGQDMRETIQDKVDTIIHASCQPATVLAAYCTIHPQQHLLRTCSSIFILAQSSS